jgi:isocitrate dehydrogenase (NAD+)
MSLLLAGQLMLEHVGRHDQAQRLWVAIDHVINQENIRTPDLGGRASTHEFAEAVARRL